MYIMIKSTLQFGDIGVVPGLLQPFLSTYKFYSVQRSRMDNLFCCSVSPLLFYSAFSYEE